MIKDERNCSVRADSYVLQYRLDRAEVVGTRIHFDTFLNAAHVASRHNFTPQSSKVTLFAFFFGRGSVNHVYNPSFMTNSVLHFPYDSLWIKI